jgi:hypothetical protein
VTSGRSSGDGAVTRRGALAGLAAALVRPAAPAAGDSSVQAVPEAFRTPFRFGKLVFEMSPDPAAFDSKFVDGPFVFAAMAAST